MHSLEIDEVLRDIETGGAWSVSYTHLADSAKINKLMFETKSRIQIEVEKNIFETMKYYFDGRCVVYQLSKSLMEETGASSDNIEGLSALGITIEGVDVSVFLKEHDDGYKVSVRTTEKLNACEICASFGGGGHARAAGCFISDTYESAVNRIVEEISKYIG